MKSNQLIVEPLLPLNKLYTLVCETDVSECCSFSAKRQRERLAWRAALRRELSKEQYADLDIPQNFSITYRPCGAPHIEGCQQLNISVSHTSTHVALLISPHRCGVDIEQLHRNFKRVASRYINTTEKSLSHDLQPQQFMALAWSAKEAVYKYGGAVGIDFLHDITITSINTTTSQLQATLLGEEVELCYILDTDFVVCYTV